MISLLTEQVAGFYDDKTKTVNLWTGSSPMSRSRCWPMNSPMRCRTRRSASQMVGGRLDEIAGNTEEDNQHIQTDEGDDARDAVTEGQAMLVYLDYTLRSSGQTLKNSPEMMDKRE